MDSNAFDENNLKRTPLFDLHMEQGARLVPFAGYEMPVQFPTGIIEEHNHTRNHAGLFDVSHMGQAVLKSMDHTTVSKALETMTSGSFSKLKPGRLRYTTLLNQQGGVIDDLMVLRPEDPDLDGTLYLVVNAARAQIDYDYIHGNLPDVTTLSIQKNQALLALQGPDAEIVLSRLTEEAAELGFMTGRPMTLCDFPCLVTRSGYTGEDGFEISCPAAGADIIARKLLSFDDVAPIGLGARDSLRLEAGLCLYSHDLDESTSPFEAGIAFAVSTNRLENDDMPGAGRLRAEGDGGLKRLRVGLTLEGRAPAREGAVIHYQDKPIGIVTSGGFSPTLGVPIAFGYVPPSLSKPGTQLDIEVRSRKLPAIVSSLPFVPTRYKRMTQPS